MQRCLSPHVGAVWVQAVPVDQETNSINGPCLSCQMQTVASKNVYGTHVCVGSSSRGLSSGDAEMNSHNAAYQNGRNKTIMRNNATGPET
uniref:Uncharacterized protein n=1 Tax=Ixodes ricinus TaxID=34613 RepID=V5HB18_IXORI